MSSLPEIDVEGCPSITELLRDGWKPEDFIGKSLTCTCYGYQGRIMTGVRLEDSYLMCRFADVKHIECFYICHPDHEPWNDITFLLEEEGDYTYEQLL